MRSDLQSSSFEGNPYDYLNFTLRRKNNEICIVYMNAFTFALC